MVGSWSDRSRIGNDPSARDLRCLAMHDFFSIGLLVSYRFMFFFIDWKLPPPACPGTTGISEVSQLNFLR